MAEPAQGKPILSNRLLITIVSSVVIAISIFFLWSFRGCIPSVGGQNYTTIYSNLDLKDAANVITRLKELKVSYQLRDNGTSVVVPKDKADEARLGLAIKNLPAGGLVGWEIFNETRMGATDFDRRIQLIRAISGELSRNIRRILGVEDARVQIVIPETRLFEVSKAPVTAAVLIKLSPGINLKPEQISGIIHLTASSVENLRPENVTVVDESGTILSANIIPQISTPVSLPEILKNEAQKTTAEQAASEEVKVKEFMPAKIEEAKKEQIPVLTHEEKVLLRLKAKEEYERQLTVKIQELLNQYYPPSSVITKVIVEYGSFINTKSKNGKIETGILPQPIKNIKVFVLVDTRISLTKSLKTYTYQSVSEVVNYNRSRGDRIILKKVPFHYAMAAPLPPKTKPNPLGNLNIVYIIYIFAGIALIGFIYLLFRPKKAVPVPFKPRPFEGVNAYPTENEAASAVDQIKKMADEDPEKIASLLRRWLSE
ncbi:MAG: flagellar M-ring protein FliF [Candidatus Saganbacteria bacterium]|uniref:Flagellar M-ring protein FliF n=1 Tax=Candidatus Saganbacteria bacterium TaxID=2575572 RepID=A0A833NRK0_UNCSA|nr:MAG: flagellar M-ring protein FliF [Candidatus Saganbacteria bacterium]